jgi:site-specific recombinase XerD
MTRTRAGAPFNTVNRVFATEGKKPLSASIVLQKYLRTAAVKAGVIKEGEKVRFDFHNFRHALATALVKLKADPKTVQGMLRHEDFGTTMQLYAQSDMESMRDAQGKFLEASSWSSYWATGFTCSRRRFSEKPWVGTANRGLDRGLGISALRH